MDKNLLVEFPLLNPIIIIVVVVVVVVVIIIIIIIIIMEVKRKDASLNKILTRRNRVACHYHSLK